MSHTSCTGCQRSFTGPSSVKSSHCHGMCFACYRIWRKLHLGSSEPSSRTRHAVEPQVLESATVTVRARPSDTWPGRA